MCGKFVVVVAACKRQRSECKVTNKHHANTHSHTLTYFGKLESVTQKHIKESLLCQCAWNYSISKILTVI